MTNFISNYTTITHYLHQLTKKTTPWFWIEHHTDTMSKLENVLHKACTLIYFDSNKTTVINTDNSLVDISPVLTQEGHVIQFTNQVCTPIELRYEQFETVTKGM